jgi:hypothetical protein
LRVLPRADARADASFACDAHTRTTRLCAAAPRSRAQASLARCRSGASSAASPGFLRLRALADDAACAVLPLATVVTCLYYGLLFANPRLVEEMRVPTRAMFHARALSATTPKALTAPHAHARPQRGAAGLAEPHHARRQQRVCVGGRLPVQPAHLQARAPSHTHAPSPE